MGQKKRQHLEVAPAELAAIVEQTRGALSPEDFTRLKAALDTLAFVTAELQAKGTSLERLRCSLCGEVYTAQAPEAVGAQKYDETAVAMMGLLKYGCGLPFHRIEKLQEGLGIPLPASTQWGLVEDAARKLQPAFEELCDQAAQADVLHNDDTPMKVLDVSKAQLEAASAGGPAQRTGVYTSGVIATKGERAIALFFTGRRHAGENLADVLKRRAAQLKTPVQRCDALAANTAGDFKALLAHCLAHARRGFVEVVSDFPQECRFVLETLGDVYRTDAVAKEGHLTSEERLALHQRDSGPRMQKLAVWLEEQVTARRVEPNSGLGAALKYLRKHWPKLTLFLREPGAPLGRVEHWRGDQRGRGVAVAGRFRVLRAGASFRSTIPFPVPAHRTGRAALPHPALT